MKNLSQNLALNVDADADGVFGDELAPGTPLCHGQYVIDKYLNSGGFGVTYLARDSLERQVVIKECYPVSMCCRAGAEVRLRSPSYVPEFTQVVDLFEKEARALAQMQHPGIVGVHQIFQDNGTAYMALDYIEGHDLLDVLEIAPDTFSPGEVRRLLLNLLEALDYVHANGILHRDISPDNILLDQSGSPVLIDFGAARAGATRASRVLSSVHTVKDGYSPPEFYFVGSPQSQSSDLYALAATFHHLVSGAPPPNSSLRMAAITEGNPDPYEPLVGRVADYDAHFLESIDQCLNLFARDRIDSAAAWRNQIDDQRRRAAALEKAKTDEQIDKMISLLVDKTRREMAADEKRRKTEPVKRAVQAVDDEQQRRAAEREYWAILNEDPNSWRGAFGRGRAGRSSAGESSGSDGAGAGHNHRSWARLLRWSRRLRV